MQKRLMVALAVAGFAAAGWASGGAARGGDAPRPGRQPDMEQRVAGLEKRNQALEARVQEQEVELGELRERVEAVEGWLQALPGVLTRFGKGLERVREKGFTYAGANVDAREILLQVLHDLGSGLLAARPEPEKEPR